MHHENTTRQDPTIGPHVAKAVVVHAFGVPKAIDPVVAEERRCFVGAIGGEVDLDVPVLEVPQPRADCCCPCPAPPVLHVVSQRCRAPLLLVVVVCDRRCMRQGALGGGHLCVAKEINEGVPVGLATVEDPFPP